MNNNSPTISWEDFTKIDMRVGTVIAAEKFEAAKKPAYKITIDFGEFGIRKTSAQVTLLYTPESLIGKQVIAIVNFPTKQIANIQSQCLILGAVEGDAVNLLTVDLPSTNGLRIA
jgi:tRNA-binding protein